MAVKVLCFDIETRATTDTKLRERLETEAFERRPVNNTLKTEKERWDTPQAQTERMNEALAKTSVDCLYAEPICCVWRSELDDAGVDGVWMADDERQALIDLSAKWEAMTDSSTVWVGHNLIGFDLPILLNRWRRNCVAPPTCFPQFRDGRWMGRIWDTMLRTPAKTPFISLENASLAYGLPSAKSVVWRSEPMTGARVAEALAAGERKMLVEYCATDVEADFELYQAQTFAGRWGTIDGREQIAAAVREIESSKLTEGQKNQALVTLLNAAGMIPR